MVFRRITEHLHMQHGSGADLRPLISDNISGNFFFHSGYQGRIRSDARDGENLSACMPNFKYICRIYEI